MQNMLQHSMSDNEVWSFYDHLWPIAVRNNFEVTRQVALVDMTDQTHRDILFVL